MFYIRILKMKLTILLLALTSLIVQLSTSQVLPVQQLVVLPPQRHNLQFHNKTGSGLTPEQFAKFIELANYASTVYGDNVEKNMKYIKLRMDYFYGKPNFNFFVFIQTEQEVNGWSIFVIVDSVYAAVEGINKYFPKWSYFFVRNMGSNLIEQYAYFHEGMGTGFTKDLQDLTQILIAEYEGEECTCESASLRAIGDGLYIETSQAWSVVCDSRASTYALIRSYQDKWIVAKGKNCYYTIYT